MKRVLMVAYHFPPFTGSSGVQRTLRFAQQLSAFGWEPIVLTVQSHAYEQTSSDLSQDVSSGIRVERAFALDSARHLSIGGRYPAFLARPDRWISWRFAAVAAGMRLIRECKPQAVWSTFPIATAHVIGYALQVRSALPWIADFRDPMAQDGYPSDPALWRSFSNIEKNTVERARFTVFTTPGAARMYRDRYPEAAARIEVIENGYDEESFVGITRDTRLQPLNPDGLTLLHSGIVYPIERDPTMLFAALRRLADEGKLRRGAFRLRFRAAEHDDFLLRLTNDGGLGDFVEIMPPIAYRQALEEMVRADALLLLQAANCNEQIPAKLYEYLRAGRPVLALTDPRGDTAATVRSAGLDTIARLDSTDEIYRLLQRFLGQGQAEALPVPDGAYVARASRSGRTASLAALLDAAAADRR